MASPLRVLIIGARSAGLLMAHVFKKIGISATVSEQDSSPTARPRDWNFGIYWAQARLEEILTPELNAALDTMQTDPAYKRHAGSVLPLINGKTGEPLKDLGAPYCLRLRRRPWLELLRGGLDVRFSKRLAHISTVEDGVIATFTDGTTESGNLLIGADGAHSIVRQYLFQESPQDALLLKSPILATVAITTLDRGAAAAIRKLNPTFHMTLDSNDPANWTFLIVATWHSEEDTGLQGDDAILDDLRSRAHDLTFPFKESLATIPRGTKMWHTRMDYWPTKPWDSRGGLVTLAGDAAHSMTFHRGQGLGNAIRDVAELQSRLGAMASNTPAELAKAVQAYETDLWPRGYDVAMANLENSIRLHDWDSVTKSLMLTEGLSRVGERMHGASGQAVFGTP
ncbi:hypothetical protein B0T25DRAFT_571986 [Lasiosphaeria hispida]|uniref:FAD-binding domain-containing protein n=1 Tax=Lasiosphaeria hispida TaxID=260671 RepID=A0AAJ0HC47_9PEZI|nr:hypothetical protein B0T25DRAFT_571986 [Lasiosphaeria hispida]